MVLSFFTMVAETEKMLAARMKSDLGEVEESLCV
jgi:hypothetical protein